MPQKGRNTDTAAPIQERDDVDKVPAWRQIIRLIGYARAYRSRLAVAFVALLIAGGLGLVLPLYGGKVLAGAFGSLDSAALDGTAKALVFIVAAQAVFVFFRHYLMSWLGERIVTDLRVEVFEHLLKLPQKYFHATRSGELLSRLSDDVTRLQDIVGQDLSIALRNLISLTGAITLMLMLSPKLTLGMLAVVPPLVVAVSVWGRFLRRVSRAAQDQLAQASGGLQESLAAIDTVQAFTREKYEGRRYAAAIEAAFDLFVRRIMARSVFMSVSSFLAFSTVVAVFWFGGRMVSTGELAAEDLGTFFIFTMQLAGSVASLSGLAGRFSQAVGSTSRVFEILDTEPEIADSDSAQPLTAAEGKVVFDGVSFAYDDRDVSVIADLNLEVLPGEVCALVGPSGSGKTTVGRLLMRFWDPSAGSITLDGRDLRGIRLADLRGLMAVVSQDPVLFSGSVTENIRYGRLDASEEEIRSAAIAANADEFVRGFPDGYETVVGERGIKLSGGQRQRLSIARAILRDPKILILDEATSALDSESEHLVQSALEELQKGRTTLVIAHRLSTIRDADRIVVIDHGRVAEEGKHPDLVAKKGIYAKLVARQALDQNTRTSAS